MTTPKLYQSVSLAPVRASRAMLHEIAATFAEEEFARRGHAPFMWLLGLGTKVVWIESDWDDDDEKAFSVEYIRKLAQMLGADCYAFISEAWVAVYSGDELKSRPRPSDRAKDERDDILMVLSVDRNGHQASRWLVTQRRHGLNFLGPRVELENMPSSGQMLSILKGWS